MPKRYFFALVISVVVAIGWLASAGATVGTATVLDSYRWSSPDPDFGGFSGLEIMENGLDFYAISDGGIIVKSRFIRDGLDGPILGVEDFELVPLLDPDGKVLRGYKNDAEGLAVDNKGQIFVSFEGVHRVWRYDTLGGNAVVLPQHPDFEEMQNNSALEVLAVDADGALYTLPERSGVLTRPFPVYRLRNGTWDQPFGIPRKPPYLPVGGDFGPDGKFYLLERHLQGIFGFQSRIRRFEFTETGVTGGETLIETGTGAHDNLEGISVWRDQNGQIRITLISDDNYRAFQRTEFVEFVFPE